MEVYCHLCFLIYRLSIFQQCYIGLGISIVVYNREYLAIFDAGSIHYSKMSTNVSDNVLTYSQYNFDYPTMRPQTVKIMFTITFFSIMV